MFKKFATGIALLACTACVTGSQTGVDIGSREITTGFGSGQLTWENGRELEYKVGVFENEGFFVVCAALQGVRGGRDREAFSALNVTADGEIIMRGLRWGEVYFQLGPLVGETAACRQTETPARDNADFDVKLTRSRF